MAWWRKQSVQTPTWSLEDYHTAFVATVKAQIEQGVAPWQQLWQPGARRLPEHLVSGHAYRGVHALYLSVAQTAKGYRDNRWATATEIQALGGQVRPGEQATPVLVDDEQTPPPGAADTGQPTGGEQDRSGPRIVDSVLSEISTGFQAAVFTATCLKYTASGVRRSSAV